MAQEVLVKIAAMLGVSAFYFLLRKIYFHFQLLKLTDDNLRALSFFELTSNFATIFELYHVIIPVFIKYHPKATGKKLLLEIAILKNLTLFWVLIGLALVVSIIAGCVFGK